MISQPPPSPSQRALGFFSTGSLREVKMKTFCHSPHHARQQGMSRAGKGQLGGPHTAGERTGSDGHWVDEVTSLEKGEETGRKNQEPLIPALTKGLPGAGRCAGHGRAGGGGGGGWGSHQKEGGPRPSWKGLQNQRRSKTGLGKRTLKPSELLGRSRKREIPAKLEWAEELEGPGREDVHSPEPSRKPRVP